MLHFKHALQVFAIVAVFVSVFNLSPAIFAQKREPVRVILDTDMGNDVNDVLALAVTHALGTRGECALLGVSVTKNHEYAAPMVDVINTYYHRGNTPVAQVRSGASTEEGPFNREVVKTVDERQLPAFPHRIQPEMRLIEAVAFLRKTLVAEKDDSLVLVQIGFSTNFARLLDTKADSISPLNGRQLVEKKVKFLCISGGNFDPASEEISETIKQDIPSAQKLLANWPTPIFFCGREIGSALQFPARSIRNDFQYAKFHPIVEAYTHFCGRDRDVPLTDPLCVLYAIRSEEAYFDFSPPGLVTIDARGKSVFREAPNGNHRYFKLTPTQIVRAREAIVQLASQPPIK